VILDVSASMNAEFNDELAGEIIARPSQAKKKFDAAKDYVRLAAQKMPPDSNLILICFGEIARVAYDKGKQESS
jgi:hypothetical protein